MSKSNTAQTVHTVVEIINTVSLMIAIILHVHG
jgi:hypothetical protein